MQLDTKHTPTIEGGRITRAWNRRITPLGGDHPAFFVLSNPVEELRDKKDHFLVLVDSCTERPNGHRFHGASPGVIRQEGAIQVAVGRYWENARNGSGNVFADQGLYVMGPDSFIEVKDTEGDYWRLTVNDDRMVVEEVEGWRDDVEAPSEVEDSLMEATA